MIKSMNFQSMIEKSSGNNKLKTSNGVSSQPKLSLNKMNTFTNGMKMVR
jgi:hypothetical protein